MTTGKVRRVENCRVKAAAFGTLKRELRAGAGRGGTTMAFQLHPHGGGVSLRTNRYWLCRERAMRDKQKRISRKAKPRAGARAVFRLLAYARPYWRSLVLAVFGLLFASLLGLLNLLLLKPAVEVLGSTVSLDPPAAVSRARSSGRVRALQPLERSWKRLLAPVELQLARAADWLRERARTHREGALWIIAGAMFVLAVLKSLTEFACQYLLGRSCYGMVSDLHEDLFRRVIAQDYLFFARRSTGWLESRIQSDVAALRRTVETLLRQGFQAPFQLFFLAVLLLALNLPLTLIAAGVGLLAAGPMLYLSRAVRRIVRQTRREADRQAAALEESLRNYPIVKFFRSEAYEIEKFRSRNRRLLACHLKNRLAQFGSAPVAQLAAAAGRSAILIVGGYLVFGGQMEFSTLVVYLVALTRFYGPGRSRARASAAWPALSVSAERMGEILDWRPAVREEEGALPLERVHNAIEFKNVSFAYEGGAVEALAGISLRVPVGRTVALVGPSGAGKTTLMGLLARLFDPTSGTIEIDGTDIRRFRLDDLRRILSVVTQDTILFNDTVARNIAYPDLQPDMGRVEAAARAAHAHEFIVALDGGAGYDTVIGQGGQRLSGGQRQRIAIARALYRDPQILIFDEATSSLDEQSQAHVQAAVQNLFRGRTVFIIAHRLSTVRAADEIVVLQNGRILERGTHEALVQQGGYYASLCRISSGDLLSASPGV